MYVIGQMHGSWQIQASRRHGVLTGWGPRRPVPSRSPGIRPHFAMGGGPTTKRRRNLALGGKEATVEYCDTKLHILGTLSGEIISVYDEARRRFPRRLLGGQGTDIVPKSRGLENQDPLLQ